MIAKLRTNPSSIALIIAILILSASLGNGLLIYIRQAIEAVKYPYPLDYGEGSVLDQTVRLANRENIYNNSFASPPYTVSNHPPLFMLLQAPLVQVFGPALWYGRVISIISLFFTATFLGLTVFHFTKDLIASLISGLLLFTIPFFFSWSVLNRVDTLALALSWAGLYTIIRWPEVHRSVVLGGVFFAAAIFTQQTYILVAPITALTWLLQTRRTRRAVELFVIVSGICLMIFLIVNKLTYGGFYLNLQAEKIINAWNIQQVAGSFIEFSFHVYILVLVAFLFLIAERLGSSTSTWPFVLPYFLAAILVSIAVGKSSSIDNYLYELAAAYCLVTGAAIAWLNNNWARAVLLLLITIQINSLISWTSAEYLPKFDEKITSQAEIQKLANMIGQTDGPILVDEYMGLLPLAGKRVYYQPFEFSQLIQAGLWDSTPLINDLQTQKFKIILIYFPKDFQISLNRWPRNIYSVFWDYYYYSDNVFHNLVLLPK